MAGFDRLALAADRVQVHFGDLGTWTASRLHTLQDADGAVETLTVVDTAAAGASTLRLRDNASRRLSGEAPAGLLVTIGAASHTLVSAARADGGELAVIITPVLAGQVNAGATVTVADRVVFDLPDTASHFANVRGLPGELAAVVEKEIIVPRSAAPATFTPQRGDLLTSPDGTETLEVKGFSADEPGLWGLLAGGSQGGA